MRGQHADYAPPPPWCALILHVCVSNLTSHQQVFRKPCPPSVRLDSGGGDNVSRLIVPVGERHPNHSPSSGSAHLLKF